MTTTADRYNLAPGYWACRCHNGNTLKAAGVRMCNVCGAVNPAKMPRKPASISHSELPPHTDPVPGIQVRPPPSNAGKATTARPGMNKTEARYRELLMHLVPSVASVRFQPVRLFLANGHSYRPDFLTKDNSGDLTAHEVKGAFIRSRDSRILFDQARQEFGWLIRYWCWAQWKDGKWTIET